MYHGFSWQYQENKNQKIYGLFKHYLILLGVNGLLLRGQWIMFEEIIRKDAAVNCFIANAHKRKANTLKAEATARNKMKD